MANLFRRGPRSGVRYMDGPTDLTSLPVPMDGSIPKPRPELAYLIRWDARAARVARGPCWDRHGVSGIQFLDHQNDLALRSLPFAGANGHWSHL